MDALQPGEEIILEGRAGYETQLNRGSLVLTNQRMIWERSFSMDPFGSQALIIPLDEIKSCEREGDAILLKFADTQAYLFVDWLPLSFLSGGRRTKEWLRAINRALKNAATVTA